LEKAENTVKNLSVVLAGLNVKAGEVIERALILAGQLKEIFLSLILLKEKEIIEVLSN
jgi:hypothetical protein